MSTPPENTPGNGTPGPWSTHPATGEHERLSPPAPMIELDTPQQTGSVKPLGPRRLARLQREMAEHAQRIQETERRSGGGEVDEALLATQHRLAELAVRAAAANEQDRRDAERAVAAQPAPSGSTPGEDDAARSVPAERVTVTLPSAERTATGGLDLPVSVAGPASLPASALHHGPVTETSMIPIQVTAREQDGAGAGSAASAGTDSDAAADAPAASGTATSAPGQSTATAPSELPAAPVRAVDAEGLQLLEPKAYTRAGAPTRILLALLLVVVVVLAVALIVFIL